MNRFALAVSLGLALVAPAMAQQPPPVDPRLAGPLVQALQAQVAFQQAAIKAMQEDEAKKEADQAAWFKAWFGDGTPAAEGK